MNDGHPKMTRNIIVRLPMMKGFARYKKSMVFIFELESEKFCPKLTPGKL